MAEIDLPDVNLWIAISCEDHPFHERAKRYWEYDKRRKVGFCQITMLAFLRLTCNKHVMAGNPFSPVEAWKAYQSLLKVPDIRYLDEPVELNSQLSAMVGKGMVSPRLWTDAVLAAFALSGGYRIVSFDTDFEKMDDLEFLLLKQDGADRGTS